MVEGPMVEIRVIDAQGLPQDVTEEEIRKFVLLMPGEDGIKKINIERVQSKARAKIYFLDPKAAETATCFNGMLLRGQKVQIEEVADPLEKELDLLERELEAYETEANSLKPESTSVTSTPKTAPATLETEPEPSTSEPEIIEEAELPPAQPAEESGTEEVPTDPKIQPPAQVLGLINQTRPNGRPKQKWIAFGTLILLTVIALILVLTLVLTQKSEELMTATTPTTAAKTQTQQKLQQLDEQLKELEQLLDE